MKHVDQFKKYALFLSFLLIGGLLSHSVIFFTLNETLNPVESLKVEITQDIAYWRQMGENVVAVCSSLYCLGHVIMACYGVKKRLIPPVRSCILYFAAQIALMIVCTVPFACFNPLFFGDYVFPIWGIAGVLGMIIAVSLCIKFYQSKKQNIC